MVEDQNSGQFFGCTSHAEAFEGDAKRCGDLTGGPDMGLAPEAGLVAGLGWTRKIKVVEYIDVPLVQIDDTLPSDLIVDCAKLDVEGNELQTLRGMRNTIPRCQYTDCS